ncbi:MAG: CRISPR-associated protein Cas4 [Bacteroidales bacterium]|nr:CRISPR-associated protein Cas4 [Bacteroidales bacterium]
MPAKKLSAVLSKSTFIRGLQCQKSLYLHKKRPFLRDRLSPEQLAKFSRGTNVGVYAQELFPGGVDASPATHFQMAASVVKTRELMDAGQKVIYEAAFEHAGVIIALDILVKDEAGWKAIEVKSSKAISETYLWDASLQYFVMKGSGIEISDFSLAYINTAFVRKGPINPAELFKIESVLPVVLGRQEQVGRKIEKLKEVIELKNSPPIPIGPQCHKPYPCDFIGHCWKNVPAGSVFDLKGLDEAQKFKYFESGIIKAEDIPETELDEKTIARQVKSMAMGQAAVASKDLKAFLDQIKMPAAVFSWLDFIPAMPIFEDTRPYQSVPYSFALKGLEASENQAVLFTTPAFPEREMLEEIIDAVLGFETILIFGPQPDWDFLLKNVGAEQALQKKVELLLARSIDLSQPFNDYSIAWPGMRHADSPEVILAGLHQPVLKPAGKIKTRLEAALAIEKLALGNHNDDFDKVLREVEAFHSARVSNTVKLVELARKMAEA